MYHETVMRASVLRWRSKDFLHLPYVKNCLLSQLTIFEPQKPGSVILSLAQIIDTPLNIVPFVFRIYLIYQRYNNRLVR